MAIEVLHEEPANIPIIDFSILNHGPEEEREIELRKLDESLRSLGFIYLSNHTIAQKKVDEALEWVFLH